MLLALIDLDESGELTTRSFTRSLGLALRFRSYGGILRFVGFDVLTPHIVYAPVLATPEQRAEWLTA